MTITREAFEAWKTAQGINKLSEYEIYGFAGSEKLLNSEIDLRMLAAWQAATAAERERCALVCDAYNTIDNPVRPSDCAAAIRQGGEA